MRFSISEPAIAQLAQQSDAHRRFLMRCAFHEHLLGGVLTITVAADRGFRLGRRFTVSYACRIDDAA